MILMNRFRGLRGLTVGLTFMALLWTMGCARPDGPPNDAATHTDPHQVPFEAGDGSLPNRSGEPLAAKDSDNDPSSASALPFHDAQNLPAGTLLTVRLKNPISADNPGPNATFDAVLDEPVVIAGNRLIPRGVTVSGRVESAGASNVRNTRGGYVRLALDSIQFTGANLPIQTSSLFVRGNAGDPFVPKSVAQQGGVKHRGVPPDESLTAIRLEKGRRLTFRLAEPAYVALSQHTRTDR
jgi:hypothetical protein